MTKDDVLKYLINKRTKVSKKIDSEMKLFDNSGEWSSSDAVWFGRLAEYDILDYLVKLLELPKNKIRFYRVKTRVLILAGDLSKTEEHLFETKGDAEKFIKDFLEIFPENKSTMDDPWLVSKEPEEIFHIIPDPYEWLRTQKRFKEERNETHNRSK